MQCRGPGLGRYVVHSDINFASLDDVVARFSFTKNNKILLDFAFQDFEISDFIIWCRVWEYNNVMH